MSDSENINDNKTADTAPDIKEGKQKNDQPILSKSNIIIPLALLLVSAIVIIATFYKDEYNNLIADNDSQTNEMEVTTTGSEKEESTVAATTQIKNNGLSSDSLADNNITEATEKQATENTAQNNVAIAEDVPADTKFASKNKAQVKPVLSANEVKASQQGSNLATTQMNTVNNQAMIKATPQTYQQRGQSRNSTEQARRHAYDQARGRAQEQAKKHNAVMQQRRQAYAKEMQARHQQHQAEMKVREEKRAQFFAAQKTMFQRVQKKRIETNKKLQEIHKRISDLHNEMHQIMQQSPTAYREQSFTQAPEQTVEHM